MVRSQRKEEGMVEVEFLVVACDMSFIRRPVLSLQQDSSLWEWELSGWVCKTSEEKRKCLSVSLCEKIHHYFQGKQAEGGPEDHIISLVIHKTAHAALPSGWCCAAFFPWLQDRLSALPMKKEPADNSHQVPGITPPAWLCLCLKAQQEVVM